MTHPLTDLLLSHRNSSTTIDHLPQDLAPPDMATAYAIQDETLAAVGPIGAWKVTPFPQIGEPACSPLPSSYVQQDGARLAHAELKGLGIEVEVAVTLARDLPATATLDDVKSAIGSVHLALELIASRYTDRQSMSREAAFADLQSSGGIILGSPIAFEDMPEFGDQAMSLHLDGARAAETMTGPTTQNLLSAIAWLARHAVTRGTPLTSGTVIITGARLGPVPFSGRTAKAEASGLGSIAVTFA